MSSYLIPVTVILAAIAAGLTMWTRLRHAYCPVKVRQTPRRRW